MSMKRPRPTFDQTTAEARGLLMLIWNALEAGILHARTYFDDETDGERPYEASLFAMLVRARAKSVLDGAGAHAEFDDLEFEPLQNVGLRVRQGAHTVRIRLSQDLSVPLPRSSASLQEYYSNPCVIHLFKLDEVEQAIEEMDEPIKLMFVWRAFPKTYKLEAALALPRVSSSDGDSVSVWWLEPLPHPSALTAVVASESGEGEDLPTQAAEPSERAQEDR